METMQCKCGCIEAEFCVSSGRCSFEGTYVLGESRFWGELTTWEDVSGYSGVTLGELIEDIELQIKMLERFEEEYQEDSREQRSELRQLIWKLVEVGRLNIMNWNFGR
jgi:hypothetical protein